MCTLRKVDATDELWADELHILHDMCFGKREAAPIKDIEIETGFWWLAFDVTKPVAFGGITPGKSNKGFGYLCRAGVKASHRGLGLQRKLIRVRERYAKRLGWKGCITDTSYGNNYSANNIIAEGYKLFTPQQPWSFSDALYWRKIF